MAVNPSSGGLGAQTENTTIITPVLDDDLPSFVSEHTHLKIPLHSVASRLRRDAVAAGKGSESA